MHWRSLWNLAEKGWTVLRNQEVQSPQTVTVAFLVKLAIELAAVVDHASNLESQRLLLGASLDFVVQVQDTYSSHSSHSETQFKTPKSCRFLLWWMCSPPITRQKIGRDFTEIPNVAGEQCSQLSWSQNCNLDFLLPLQLSRTELVQDTKYKVLAS